MHETCRQINTLNSKTPDMVDIQTNAINNGSDKFKIASSTVRRDVWRAIQIHLFAIEWHKLYRLNLRFSPFDFLEA